MDTGPTAASHDINGSERFKEKSKKDIQSTVRNTVRKPLRDSSKRHIYKYNIVSLINTHVLFVDNPTQHFQCSNFRDIVVLCPHMQVTAIKKRKPTGELHGGGGTCHFNVVQQLRTSFNFVATFKMSSIFMNKP